MKKAYLLFLAAILFTACRKEDLDNRIIVEPPFQSQISADTITNGQLYGLTIGQTSLEVYTKIQQVQAAEKMGNLNIVNNVFTNIDSLKTRLPLYTGIFMDEEKGTPNGVQLGFENNKVKTIFLNDGTMLAHWPSGFSTKAVINVGDPVDGIYQKLASIKKDDVASKKLQRLSVFFKDNNKPFDPQMSASPQWYFIATLSAKRYNHVSLNFAAGKLVSIYTTVFESQ